MPARLCANAVGRGSRGALARFCEGFLQAGEGAARTGDGRIIVTLVTPSNIPVLVNQSIDVWINQSNQSNQPLFLVNQVSRINHESRIYQEWRIKL